MNDPSLPPRLVSVAVRRGNEMLKIAESVRREPAASFTLKPSETPDADYAAAMLLVSGAMHHLEESLPSRQAVRTDAALSALLIGAELLRQALQRYGRAPMSW